ncbi:serine/threonine-protein kinase ULK3 [Paragonimus westermani]|uniref:non-specific serine/threonine protein kinase n=1 Tax=Paragonimus westermani TaxID=34504 RepID=A0A5J4NPD8_9TREM|nr:serine/threonine-protein kinase ULK3 [Paragonimus westermani]
MIHLSSTIPAARGFAAEVSMKISKACNAPLFFYHLCCKNFQSWTLSDIYNACVSSGSLPQRYLSPKVPTTLMLASQYVEIIYLFSDVLLQNFASYFGCVLANDHEIMLKVPGCNPLRKLGQGSYGEVYLAKKRGSEQLIAVKCISKLKLSKRGEDNLVSEIAILQKLEHPHIVRLLDFTWDSAKVYLYMEYCAGGDLSQYIRAKHRLPEKLVRRFLRQLGLALQYLKSKNVVHMDLKPQNILLTLDSNPILKVTGKLHSSIGL